MKKILFLVFAFLALACVAAGISSCNVTRVVTNESKYHTRGDTAVVIQTKTVETYDARRE